MRASLNTYQHHVGTAVEPELLTRRTGRDTGRVSAVSPSATSLVRGLQYIAVASHAEIGI